MSLYYHVLLQEAFLCNASACSNLDKKLSVIGIFCKILLRQSSTCVCGSSLSQMAHMGLECADKIEFDVSETVI